MNLTQYFYKNKMLFWALMCMLVVGGFLAYTVMPKLEDPTVSIKQAQIITFYPGASAHEVELEITALLEDELRTLADVMEISSTSSDNMSKISLTLLLEVPPKEMEQRWDILRRKVELAALRLPQGAYQPIVIDDVSDIYGMFFCLTADGYTYPEIQKYAEKIRRELLNVEGVKRVTFFGTRDEVINITLPREMIARNSIYPLQIMMGIDALNKPINAGYLFADDQKIKLDVDGKIKSEEDVRNMMIKSPNGELVKLSDIAEVERGFVEPQTEGFWVGGKPAIAIMISMEPNAVVPDVGKLVDKRMAELKTELPAGFEYDKVYSQPDRVSGAMGSFIWNIIISVMIVIVVIMLAMGFRAGIIIGVGLALTVLGTFPVLLAVDGTLQRISLGAFIVAMGMLVDNAVVVMDGILVDRKRGLPPKQSLFRTARITAMPLLGATLVALITFLPVGLSPDTIGEYASDLFYVLAISLLISWLLSITQVPIFASLMLPNRYVNNNFKKSDKEPVLQRFLRKALNLFMKHKITTFFISIAFLGLSIFGFSYIKIKFFPDFDYNQLYIEYTLPAQTNSDRVKKDLLEITEKLSEYKEIELIAACQGRTPSRYSLARAINAVGDNYGELILNFADYKEAYRLMPEIQQRLRDEYPDAYIRVRKYSLSINASHTVEVMFSGPDPAVLHALSEQAQAIMKNSEEVDHYSVTDNWKPLTKTINAQYAEQQAKSAGVGREDIAKALQASSQGVPTGLVYDANKRLIIYLKVRDNEGNKLADLNDIPVWSMVPNASIENINTSKIMMGNIPSEELVNDIFKAVPLSQATTGLKISYDESVIQRFNGQRAIKVQCDPAQNSATSVAKSDILDKIEAIELPVGYSLIWHGEGKTQKIAIENIVGYLPLVFTLIIIILLLLFNSIRKMTLVLFCLPFAIIGVVLVLVVSNVPFTFMAIVGIVGLLGMLIKNSIVLVDEITRRTKEGVEPYTAIIESTINRSRPVIMASATTVLGLMPLIPDPMYGSLAVVVIGGLTVGTLITLVLLPIIYALLFRVKANEEVKS